MALRRWLGILASGVVASLLLAACGQSSPPEPAVAVACQGSHNISSYRYTINVQLDIPRAPSGSEGVGPAFSEGVSPLGAFAPIFLGLLSDFEIEGAFLAPDRSQAVLTAEGEEIEVRTIGSRSWVRLGTVWQEGTNPGQGVFLSPQSICTDIVPTLSEALSDLDYQRQTVNGVASRHYLLDEAHLAPIGDRLSSAATANYQPERLALDVWLAEEGGWPVQMKLTVSGEDEEGQPGAASVFMEFWDINSPDIEIEPPAMGG